MRKQARCRGCKSERLQLVFTLGEQSLTGFLLKDEHPRWGTLDMMLCENCNLAQLGHTYPGDWFYDWYGYRSGTNPMMVKSLAELAHGVESHLRLGDTVLDLGSNDGTFLRLISTPGIRRVGIDPVKNLGPSSREGLHLFVNDYFSASLLREHVSMYGPVQVVTAIAMFYELEDPVAFLRDVESILVPNGVLVIQMNYLPMMLDANGYDNIVHEHQTYFSLSTLLPVLDRAGFRALEVSTNSVNGGSFRVWATKIGSTVQIPSGDKTIRDMLSRERDMRLADVHTYEGFHRRINDERRALRAIVDQVHNDGGRIYVYGASTRGLAIMEFTGLDHELIEGAAERNRDKYGRTYGATGIKCVPEDEAREKANYFLILPHHFLAEFLERERAWMDRGGRFIVPLPRARVLAAGGREVWPFPVTKGAEVA